MRQLIGIALNFIFAGVVWGAPSSQMTSVDLYCDSMTLAFMEKITASKVPSSQEKKKMLDEAERELLQSCKAMPVVGGKTKLVRDMTSKERSQLSCLGIAEGISLAEISKTEDRELYSKLSAKRAFFNSACSTNPKAFLSDLNTYGPRYVMDKTY